MRCVILVIVFSLVYAVAAHTRDGVIPLPPEDSEQLEKFLGKNVIGKAVQGKPLEKPGESEIYTKGGTWSYELTSGKKSGTDCSDTIVLYSGEDRKGWKYHSCLELIDFESVDSKGNIIVTSTVNHEHGVVTRFDPPMTAIKAGVAPGDKITQTVDVKVYDLSNPDRETYSGTLDITLQYVGAYEVTVPAGTFEAALLRWYFNGKIGPATYEDRRYRLINLDEGLIAAVEQTETFVIFYHERERVGKILRK
jgi:hypothetical protein